VQQEKPKRKKLNEAERLLHGDDDYVEEKKQDTVTPYKQQKEIDNSRDNSLSIFHVLGKFLYNKRLESKAKEGRQMSYKEMCHCKKWPRFYENHAKLLQQSLLEPTSISLYLHENMLNFFDDVEDIANCWDVYSSLDGAKAKLEYQYGN
jgi:hypothetical protein